MEILYTVLKLGMSCLFGEVKTNAFMRSQTASATRRERPPILSSDNADNAVSTAINAARCPCIAVLMPSGNLRTADKLV